MPKVKDPFDLPLTVRPVIDVIKHMGNPFTLSIKGAPGEGPYRISSRCNNRKDAIARARELEELLDPKVRAEQKNKMPRIKIIDLFDLYIQVKSNGQDPDKVRTHGANAAIGKFRTLREILQPEKPGSMWGPGFLARWNALPREDKKVAPDRFVDKIEYADEITTYWLETAWRPTWFQKEPEWFESSAEPGGTYNTKNKRRDLVIEIGHWAQRSRYMKDTRKRNGHQCECLFCNMARLNKQTHDVRPTPPFKLWQYEAVVDSCALFDHSYLRDYNREQHHITGKRLKAFIEVMRWCGSRICDTAIMSKKDIHYSNGDWIWSYFPLKNKRKLQVSVTLPEWVIAQLKALPKAPSIHPDHFFWSGDTVIPKAASRWHEALTRLWTLCPDEAVRVFDIRNKQKEHATSHMFRNTFCVQARYQGLEYGEIATLIGDTEKEVRESYSPYCRDYDKKMASRSAAAQKADHELTSKLTMAELKKRDVENDRGFDYEPTEAEQLGFSESEREELVIQ